MARAQPSITSITRWSDLPQNDQQALEALEKYIQSQNDLCEDLKTRSPQLEEYVASIPTDVAEIQKRFDAISHILAMDATTLNDDLRPKVPPKSIRFLNLLILFLISFGSLINYHHKRKKRFAY